MAFKAHRRECLPGMMPVPNDDREPSEKLKVYEWGIVLKNLGQEALYRVLVDYRTGDAAMAGAEAMRQGAEGTGHTPPGAALPGAPDSDLRAKVTLPIRTRPTGVVCPGPNLTRGGFGARIRRAGDLCQFGPD